MYLFGTDRLTNMRRREELFNRYLEEINKMINNIQTDIEEVKYIRVKVSNTTDSVYMYVSFENTDFKYKFSIRNHKSKETYKGKKYMLIQYNTLEELKEAIKKDIIKIIANKLIRC